MPMKISMLRCLGLALSLSIALGLSPAYASEPETINQTGSISYVSGGTGEASMERMKAREGDFNFRLLMAENNGAYLSDVKVTLKQGGKTLMRTRSDGPILLAKLAAGKYTLIAESGGKSQQKDFTVPARGSARLDLRWPAQD